MEIGACFLAGFGSNWYFENGLVRKAIGLPQILGSDCLAGLITLNFVGDIVRTMAYFIPIYIVVIRSKTNFPLPFTWVFNDLKMFIFEPYSLKIFRMYIEEIEPQLLKPLDDILLAYLESFENRTSRNLLSTGSKTHLGDDRLSRKQHIRDNLFVLDESFKRFKTTRAFHQLFLRVKEFENISIQAYD